MTMRSLRGGPQEISKDARTRMEKARSIPSEQISSQSFSNRCLLYLMRAQLSFQQSKAEVCEQRHGGCGNRTCQDDGVIDHCQATEDKLAKTTSPDCCRNGRD